MVLNIIIEYIQFPRWLGGKNLPVKAVDVSLIPGLGRSPGEGNGTSLHCFCLENPMGN